MDKDVAALNRMPVGERKALVERIYVGHPHARKLLEQIDYCRTHSKMAAEPDGMLITGAQGMGKTTLWRRYASRFPRTRTDGGVIVPVLPVGIQAPATPKSLVTVLLSALGDPASERGSLAAQTLRLYRYLEKCQTELLILDEFQHFIDRDSSKILKTISDWLKMLMNEAKLPIVLIGMPVSVRVLDAQGNEQLKRRFSMRESLKPFAWTDEGSDQTFRKFLKMLDGQLPLVESSNLADRETAFRLHCATGGEMYRIMNLVRAAAALAIDEGVERLDLRFLSRAYRRLPLSDDLNADDPFDEGFVHKPVAKKASRNGDGEDVGGTNRRVKAGSRKVQLSSVLVK